VSQFRQRSVTGPDDPESFFSKRPDLDPHLYKFSAYFFCWKIVYFPNMTRQTDIKGEKYLCQFGWRDEVVAVRL
jgi:hypothetical protein